MRLRTRNVVLVAGAVTALLAVPASADAGTAPASARPAAAQPAPPPGAHGPIVTHPTESPVDYPAGEVCAFPSHTDFPVDDLTLKTWVDAAGDPVFAEESGPLIQRSTNLDTGKTVERDISGSGVITYPDADSFVLSGNDGRWCGSRPSRAQQVDHRGAVHVGEGQYGERTDHPHIARTGGTV